MSRQVTSHTSALLAFHGTSEAPSGLLPSERKRPDGSTGVLKISLAGANNLVPTTGLTPCIIILHVYTCNYSGARKNIDAR